MEGAANIRARLREHSPSARNVLSAYRHPIRWLKYHNSFEKHEKILCELSANGCDGFSLEEEARRAMRSAARNKVKAGIKALAACERECERAVEKTGARSHFSGERFGELTLAVFNSLMRHEQISGIDSGRRLENWFIAAGAALGVFWAVLARGWGEGSNLFLGGSICFLAAGAVSKLQSISQFARGFTETIGRAAEDLQRQS